MPARKRAKGKARKAAKANKPEETETKKNDTNTNEAFAKQKGSEQQLHDSSRA